MKKKIVLFVMLICSISVIKLDASTGLLKSASIIECDGELYGFHSSDNHYHLAEKTEDGKYKSVGDSLGSNWVCPGTIKNINEEKQLEKVTAEFEKCVDGDTAVFKINGESIKFRFLAIDTPETVHPTKEVEAYGKDASEYTCNKLTNASKIEIEYEEEKTDKYNRSLGWIWIDDSLLQKELISYGYAEVAYIYGNYKYTTSLCETQKEAIEKNNGIWKDSNRKEGYCSTLRTVERTTDNKTIATKTEEEKTTKPKEEKNYKYEAIGATLIVLIALILKVFKR